MKRGRASIQFFKLIQHLGVLIFIFCLAVLSYSVFLSGLGYMYDADEVARVQEAYLIATGHLPYRDYYTIYSPIFPVLLVPLLKLGGFTFATIDTARFFMTVLFFIRTGILAVFVNMLFGKRTALFFIGIYLLDPFTVFSSMQVRADNLMVTVLSLGLCFLFMSLRRTNHKLGAIAGGLLVFTLCVMVKSFPTVLVVVGLFLLYAWKDRKLQLIKSFMIGGFIVLGLYFLPFILNGTIAQMIQQSLLDPGKFLGTPDYPTPLGYFYGLGNWYLYGSGSKSALWVFAWVFPILGFAGAYHAVHEFISHRRFEKGQIIVPALALSLVLQWGLLFTLHTVFIQYYIPIMWLLAIFSAFALDRFVDLLQNYRWGREVTLLLYLTLFVVLVQTSFHANMYRSKQSSISYIQYMQRVWSYIPEHAKVFPMTLFRAPAYPLAEGYFAGVHSNLIQRYPAVEEYLVNESVNFVLASDYTLGYLPHATQVYIRSQYEKVAQDFDLRVRKEYDTP